MANSVAQKPRFSVAIQTDAYQRLINNTLQDPKRRSRFLAAISSAVATNPDLQECDAGTILSCGFLGESMNLSPSPQLGHYYMVPFNDTKNNRKAATFILGYKGYIQLAARSGMYKDITVNPIKRGELIKYDRITGQISLNPIEDEVQWELTETIGYYASFEYLNGFKKSLYWSKAKMIQHADRYSKAFSVGPATINTRNGPVTKVSYEDYAAGKVQKGTEWLYSSFWYQDFDGMAQKTLIRQLLGKWGILSIEMQTAFESDNSVINADLTPEYVVTQDTEVEPINGNGNGNGAEPAHEEAAPAAPAPNGGDNISMSEL